MKPIDVAEKWTAAALALWDGTRTSDPLVATLTLRVRAHYGDHTAALSEIVAVAMLEAMSEYQAIRDAPFCQRCAHLIMPNENATELARGGYVHASKPDCISDDTLLSGVPYSEVDL
jgi:hypothetical protein